MFKLNNILAYKRILVHSEHKEMPYNMSYSLHPKDALREMHKHSTTVVRIEHKELSYGYAYNDHYGHVAEHNEKRQSP